MTLARDVLFGAGLAAFSYFALLNASYIAFAGLAWRRVRRHASAPSTTDEVLAWPLTPAVSVLLPAYNEEAQIVDSVRSLLALRYPFHEVIVVNDGSTDATLARLEHAFGLVPAERALRESPSSTPLRRSYVSSRHPNLCVLDKPNGGKADALNLALRAAHHPYVCSVDADAVLEADALARVIRPVIEDPDRVVAVGGIVRIANGCEIDDGRVTRVALPQSRLALIQVLEYFRAFLIGRTGWSRLGCLLIISGAFGLFRRDEVQAAGGYASGTVGEDAELVLRLHRRLRERGDGYRIEFVPDPVCWTEAPQTWKGLARQRRRWQQGMAETVWRHRRMLLNPSYGALGFLALPYFVLFELAGPVFELVGLPATICGVAIGAFDLTFLLAFGVVAVLLGVVISFVGIALEELTFRRHVGVRELVRLLAFSVVEQFGYRQAVEVMRLLGTVDALRRGGWRSVERRGFHSAPLEGGAA